jgi:hypothetical protein
MLLFELKNYALTFSPQALALKPFGALWDRDKSKNKTIANDELAYVFYLCDYKSDFADITDEEERSIQVLKQLNLPSKWKPDEKIYDAIEFYKERQNTLALRYLLAARKAVGKIIEFYEGVSLTALDDKGKPIYNAKQVSDTIKSSGDLIRGLNETEEEVKKGISKISDKIGSRTKNIFESGI